MKTELFNTLKNTLKYDIDPKFAYAVAMIESSGRGWDSNHNLIVRFEKHIFGKYYKDTSKVTGSNSNQYKIALELDPHSAKLSTSYGMYQIMGFNHKIVGYDTVEEMIESFDKDLSNHILAFCEFCKVNKLLTSIKLRDYTSFAKKYNGPLYYKTGYHTKLDKYYNEV